MENAHIAFIILILIIVIAIPIGKLVRSINLGQAIVAFIFNDPIPPHFEFNVKHLPPSAEKYLLFHFDYYAKLNKKQKRIFGSRVVKFMEAKNFIGRKDLRVTNEMKYLISAAAIKISFGMQDYMYDSFETIIIYPGEFDSPITKNKSKGETNSSGVIVFSWKDLKFGNEFPTDSLNLAYHEFAHALFIDHFKNNTNDSFSKYYPLWVRIVRQESKLAEVKRKHIFRDYASANEHEFYAIAVENFFERSSTFKAKLPKLYQVMTLMLNQDPVAGKIA